MTEVVVTTGAIKPAKLQIVNNKLAPSFLQAGCRSCRPTNSVGGLKEKSSFSVSVNNYFFCFVLWLVAFMA